MKLTTKGRFAVTAMLDIALHDPEQYVTIAAIGERRHLSSAYLEQIFGKLRRAGLLEGIRGPTGGYRLSKPADQITVMQILDAVDASLEKSVCTVGWEEALSRMRLDLQLTRRGNPKEWELG